MSHQVRPPRTARGPEAVLAALEDVELEHRSDPLDEPVRERFYDLTGTDALTERIRAAGEADWLTADEALEDLAVALGRESPFGDDAADLYDR